MLGARLGAFMTWSFWSSCKFSFLAVNDTDIESESNDFKNEDENVSSTIKALRYSKTPIVWYQKVFHEISFEELINLINDNFRAIIQCMLVALE